MSPPTACQTPSTVPNVADLVSHHELQKRAERMTTEVLVCVLCRPADLSRDMPRPGLALFEAIEDMALRDDLPFRIRPVDCMSGCKRHCTVALQAAGKTSYFFGDLLADDVSAEQVLACATLHQASPDGFLSRDARPERLRAGILTRLPAPLHALSAGATDTLIYEGLGRLRLVVI